MPFAQEAPTTTPVCYKRSTLRKVYGWDKNSGAKFSLRYHQNRSSHTRVIAGLAGFLILSHAQMQRRLAAPLAHGDVAGTHVMSYRTAPLKCQHSGSIR